MYKGILLLLFLFQIGYTAASPKREIRAAWLTTAYGLDWPRTRAISPRTALRQQQELCRILDQLKEANFNTILFQTRLRGDVIYPSVIEPMSEVLTGKSSNHPGYDALAFAIQECHRRGLECHAWIVSIPLGTSKQVASLGNRSVTKKMPEICTFYQKEWFLNPGHPQTKEYLASIVIEIVDRYDIDGIHLDYIRYPDHPEKFPDGKSYQKYSDNKPLLTWRRENINAIVRHLYQEVKTRKAWVKMSSSPIGKFKDTSHYSSYGWNAYHTVYQDAQQWLREGIQDILFPMMYFKGNSFYPFALDWQEKSYGRHIVPGLGIYFLAPGERILWPRSEVERQIYFTRDHHLAGQAYYRAAFIINNTQGLTDELICNFYPTPALPPAMTWLDNEAPDPPTDLQVILQGNTTQLRWQAAKDNDTKNAIRYVVYASDSYPVDITSAANMFTSPQTATAYLFDPSYPKDQRRYFAITAIDRCGNESEAVQMAKPLQKKLQLFSNTEVK